MMTNLAIEKKTIRACLENFSFEKFTEMLKGWLTNGRSVWYITGNFDDKKAIEMVEKAEAILAL